MRVPFPRDKLAHRNAQMGTIDIIIQEIPEVENVDLRKAKVPSRKLTEADLGLSQKSGLENTRDCVTII